jgi:hypothetical protein
VAPSGLVTTIAGSAGSPGSADGLGTDARFSSPTGIVIDATGTIFVADSGNHLLRAIRPLAVLPSGNGRRRSAPH